MATGTSFITIFLRARSMIIAVSTPKPGANLQPSTAKALAFKARWPERGAASFIPVKQRTPAPATALTSPQPAFFRPGGNLPMHKSAWPSRTGWKIFSASRAESPKSASSRSKNSPFTAFNPWLRAAPFPRLAPVLRTSAPAARAVSAVLSVEPSSTTITCTTPGRERAAVTVRAIVNSSLYAGIITVTTSFIVACSTCRQFRKQGNGSFFPPVMPFAGPGQSIDQRHPAGDGINIVYCCKPNIFKLGYPGVLYLRGFNADNRQPGLPGRPGQGKFQNIRTGAGLFFPQQDHRVNRAGRQNMTANQV